LVHLHNAGLPDHAIIELLGMWHEGLVYQLVNYPADLRIEKWLRDNYPELRDPQERSIRYAIGENRKVLKTSTKSFTPTLVYDASATMNAAYARYMANLYRDEKLASRFRHSGYWAEGKTLADEIWSTEDQGYKSDVDSAKVWAFLIGIDGWLEWKRAQEIRVTKETSISEIVTRNVFRPPWA
jgi:hypothetical protein